MDALTSSPAWAKLQALLDFHREGTSAFGVDYKAMCPTHPDKKRSLHITVTKDGKILLHCFAECKTPIVCAAIGITERDLFPVGVERAVRVPSKVVEVYDYTDWDGTLLYQALRYEPKGFSQRRPDGNNGWITRGVFDDVPVRALYRLVKLGEKPRESLAWVEGERDVHSLEGIGIAATTTAGGAAQPWRSEYGDQLKRIGVKRLVLFPDTDSAGMKYALRIAAEAHALEISVRIVVLPGLEEKQDVSDWLRVEGNDRARLLEIVKATPEWSPSTVAVGSEDEGPIIVDPNDDERHMIETAPFPLEARAGIAHDFAMLFDGRSDAPYEFLYTSFLTALAAAVSPYVSIAQGFGNMRVGMYTVLIGASYGGRKTSSRQWALDFFAGLESPWGNHVFVPDALPGSDVGLVKALAKADDGRRPTLLNPDEFSELIAKMTIKNSTYTELLNKMFDATRVGSISKSVDIETAVELSLLSATTDALWTETFTANTMQVGFVNRLFRVPAYRTCNLEAALPVDAVAVRALQTQVVGALRRVASSPVRLEMGPEAKEVYGAWVRRCAEVKGMLDHPDYARCETYAQRIAAVLSVAAGLSTAIDPLSMSIAVAVADWQYRARVASRPVNAANDYAMREGQLRAYLARILREPAQAGGQAPRVPRGRMVRRRDVQMHFGRWGATAFTWAVNAMVGNQEIEVVTVGAAPYEEVYIRIAPRGLFNTVS